MDQRLTLVAGSRLQRLTPNETPLLAQAMVLFIRGSVRVAKGVVSNTPYIRFYGDSTNIVVRADDWSKVSPYIKDQSFDPLVVPVANDDELYQRILTVLNLLFGP